MSNVRTTAPTHYRVLAGLVLGALAGIALGLVLAPPVVVAGVVDAGAAVRYGLPVTRVLLDVSATIVVGLSILPKLLGFDRPTHTEPVMRIARPAAVIAAAVWVITALTAIVLQAAELRPGSNVSIDNAIDYIGAVGAGKGLLAIERGIEVGHVFYLGTKYSKAMNATFLDTDGKPKHFEMGCYGIGITRLPAAAIEQNHDERGIVWPDAIAPFTVVVCPVGADRSEAVKAAADELYAGLLAAGVDVILDDRGERPGAMFADWELIGVPHRVTIGDRGLKEGMVEYQHRRDAAATKVSVAEALAFVKGRLGA